MTQTVHNLICHRDLNTALECLGSLLRFSIEPIRLFLHDDGSLGPGDVNLLMEKLPNSTIISRLETDELTSQMLRNYPHCRRFRENNPLGLKLLDIALLSEGDIAYCDSDIFFFRSFSGLFSWAGHKTSGLFMRDHQEAYSLYPWNFWGSNKIKLISRINTGLIFFKKEVYDLDFIEWLLGNVKFRPIFYWMEQTCWAALAQRVGCRLWDSNQIVVVKPRTGISNEVIAGHFTSSVRSRLHEFSSRTNLSQQRSSPLQVNTMPSQECDAFKLAVNRLSVRLERMIWR